VYLVVLGEALRTAGGARLDLTGAQSYRQVCTIDQHQIKQTYTLGNVRTSDKRILRFAGAVASHDTPAS
jgi:hypothetical protein